LQDGEIGGLPFQTTPYSTCMSQGTAAEEGAEGVLYADLVDTDQAPQTPQRFIGSTHHSPTFFFLFFLFFILFFFLRFPKADSFLDPIFKNWNVNLFLKSKYFENLNIF
jgi:hypothetical protein